MEQPSLIVSTKGRGRVNPVVEFDAFDLMQIALHAERIFCVKDTVGVQTQRCDENQSEFELIYVGAMGEYAISKYFNVPLDHKLFIGGDDGIDIQINGYCCQIKTQSRSYKENFLYFNDEDCITAPVAIHCKVVSPIKVELCGCISKKKFMQLHTIRDWGYGPRIAVSQFDLAEVDVLFGNLPVDTEAYADLTLRHA